MLQATHGMLRDLRIAVRILRTWRWGAVLAVLTLSVGIGTTTALYALLRVALSASSLDIEQIERVVRIYGVNPELGARRSPVSLADYDVLLSGVGSFEAVAASRDVEMTVGAGAADDVVKAMLVSSKFFDVMRGRALEGRLFTPADYADGAPTAVVSELTWRRRFGGRRIADAPTIRLSGSEYTVVGVLPAAFSYPMIGLSADVWIPMTRRTVDGASVMVISRLAPGVSWASAAGELSTLPAPNRSAEGSVETSRKQGRVRKPIEQARQPRQGFPPSRLAPGRGKLRPRKTCLAANRPNESEGISRDSVPIGTTSIGMRRSARTSTTRPRSTRPTPCAPG